MAYLPILYRIQEIESRLQTLRKAEEQARGNPELIALEAVFGDTVNQINQKEKDLKTVRGSQRQLELELKSCQEHLKVEEGKLYSGFTSSSRELESIQHKATEYYKSKEKLEDELLKLLEEEESLTGQIQEHRRNLENMEKQRGIILLEVDRKLREIAMEVQDLDQELSGLLEKPPAEWLERYRKIAKSHNGIGIAKIKSDSCGACHVGLSDSLYQKVKRGDDQLVFCESCGRILYF